MINSERITIDRPYYDQDYINRELNYNKCKTGKTHKCNFRCANVIQTVPKILPIIAWMHKYNWKNDFLTEISAGAVVAMMQIPQAMGLVLLAGLPPIVGIYTGFFPVIIYCLFGSSHHISMGTFSLINVMLYNSVAQFANVENSNGTSYTPIEVAITVTFTVAVIQLLMYVFRLGMLSSLLSDTFISAYMCACVINVLPQQFAFVLGIQVHLPPTNFPFILTIVEIVSEISNGNVNWMIIVISTVTIFILILDADWINPAWTKNHKLPIPIQLSTLIVGILASQYFQLEEKFGVPSIGHIPSGFPSIQIPSFALIPSIIGNAFAIAIVSYTLSLTIMLEMANRFNYNIRFNQELLAFGMCNIVGCLTSCTPVASSFSRSLVQVMVGGKTQLTSLICCTFMLTVLLWFGKYLEPLPKCMIYSLIMVALKGIVMKVKELPKYWKLSKFDGIVWISTFLVTLFTAADIGLFYGICLNLVGIFVREIRPYTCLLGNVSGTDLYLDVNKYDGVKKIDGITIFQYRGSVNFLTKIYFRRELCKALNIDLENELNRKQLNSNELFKSEIAVVIVDFSALTYIDLSGAAALKLLINDFEKLSIHFFIANISCSSYEILTKVGLLKFGDEKLHFFPSVIDAVHCAKRIIALNNENVLRNN